MCPPTYRAMTQDEFDAWSILSSADYAEDLMQNHLYSQQKAQAVAIASMTEALPTGITTESHYFRVYEKDNTVVGYLWYKIENNTAFLFDIMIIKAFQSQGLGKSLMQVFITEITCLNVDEVELRVSPTNRRALKLYEELGFKVTGHDMSLIIGK